MGLGTWDEPVPPILTPRHWRMTEHKEVPLGSVPRAGGSCKSPLTFSVHIPEEIVLQVPAVHVRRAGTLGVPWVAVARWGFASPYWYTSGHPARVSPACRDPGRVVWGPPWCQGCGQDAWARLCALPGSRCVGWVGEGGWCPLVPRPLGACGLWGVRCGVGAGGFGACRVV